MTTTAVTTAPKTTRSAPRSLAALTANYAINDTLVAFRNVAFISFTVALPIVMFLVFRMMFANQDFANSDVYASLMVNMAAYGSFAAAINAGAQIQLERASGWMRQLVVTGLPPQAFVAGKAISAMLVVLPAIICTFIVGRLAGGIDEPLWAWLASGALLWVAMVPFVVIGLALGVWLSASAVQPVATLLMLGMAMLGGLWWPLDGMPEIVGQIGRNLPTYWLGDLGRAPFIGESLPFRAAVVLLVWTAAAAGLAALGFRRAARVSKR